MPCTNQQLLIESRRMVLPVYTNPVGWENFNNNVLSHYATGGCSYLQNRYWHFFNQLANNVYGPLQTAIKTAKRDYFLYMYTYCGCGPSPIINPTPQAKLANSSTSWDCVLITPDSSVNQPSPTPVPTCVEKFYPHFGPFITEQDCIDSGCGSLVVSPTTPTAVLQPKIITNFNIDYTDIPTGGGNKTFSITGDDGASFYLEIKNEDGYYYNFITETFLNKYAKLDSQIQGQKYEGIVKFPAVTDEDQYDVYLYTKPGTEHTGFNDVRFKDQSIDLNRSTGSTSVLLQKVIYQILDVEVVISSWSPKSAITMASNTTDTISVSRYQGKKSQPFSITANVTSNAITVNRQPIIDDTAAVVNVVVGSAPIQIPGENIYPDVSNTDTVNGDFGSGATRITMDTAVANKMKLGDRVTGNASLNSKIVTVTNLVSEFVFDLSESIAIADGVTLSFSNQVNYQWPVTNASNLEEDMIVIESGNVLADTVLSKYENTTTINADTEYEEDIIIDEADAVDTSKSIPTISKGLETVAPGNIVFNKQQPLLLAGDTIKIGGYGIENIKSLTEWDVSIDSLELTLNTVTTTTTSAVGPPASTTIPVTSALGIADETTQTVNGAITDSNKVVLDSIDGLAINQTIYAVSAGTLSGNPTINSINENTKTITLSSVQTFANDITLTFANSIVSGIGIDPDVINPYITNISSLNLTASVAQTLENGQTLTFTGAGNTATITGNITVKKAGTKDLNLYFDVEKFLTYHS